jgi:hypothetical protein
MTLKLPHSLAIASSDDRWPYQIRLIAERVSELNADVCPAGDLNCRCRCEPVRLWLTSSSSSPSLHLSSVLRRSDNNSRLPNNGQRTPPEWMGTAAHHTHINIADFTMRCLQNLLRAERVVLLSTSLAHDDNH